MGLISDTHGLLRPEAVRFLQGSNFIIHAGDIGNPAVLEQLEKVAPVTAVRGNNDLGLWAAGIPLTSVLQVRQVRIYIIHDLSQLAIDPAAAGFHVVVAGHSHRPSRRSRGGVLFVNPGSAGPRRFSLPVSLGTLTVSAHRVQATLKELAASRTSHPEEPGR